MVRFGARVDPWWAQLPVVLSHLSERWRLRIGDAVGRGNTSLVVRCRLADGRHAILKIAPEAELGRSEAAALRRWEPTRRVPLVWGLDEASGALLLEAVPNETPLSEVARVVELEDVASLIGGLHRASVIAGDVSLTSGSTSSSPTGCNGTVDAEGRSIGSNAATSWHGVLPPTPQSGCPCTATCTPATCSTAAGRGASSPSIRAPARGTRRSTPSTGCSGRRTAQETGNRAAARWLRRWAWTTNACGRGAELLPLYSLPEGPPTARPPRPSRFWSWLPRSR